ncbi:hypothetical protein E3_1910 [Rhodococcus phage E3]|uniref:hypothetical protein n=1 Tax=Rhodococcus phage E3 TaxID=1007869 RepID=UPI0002C6B412|nr:hypothetical protein M176_gp203 [Rhodococcus phage E3]AEQ21111.1 hypothetical protein E3_1910 [Rhodococcus phage E3]
MIDRNEIDANWLLKVLATPNEHLDDFAEEVAKAIRTSGYWRSASTMPPASQDLRSAQDLLARIAAHFGGQVTPFVAGGVLRGPLPTKPGTTIRARVLEWPGCTYTVPVREPVVLTRNLYGHWVGVEPQIVVDADLTQYIVAFEEIEPVGPPWPQLSDVPVGQWVLDATGNLLYRRSVTDRVRIYRVASPSSASTGPYRPVPEGHVFETVDEIPIGRKLRDRNGNICWRVDDGIVYSGASTEAPRPMAPFVSFDMPDGDE